VEQDRAPAVLRDLDELRGRPLSSHVVIVETIAATTTRTGLTVRAQLDTGSCPAGVKISDQEMAALPITRHDFHGDWNYCLHPDTGQARGPAEPGPQAPAGWDRATLAHPALTGLPRNDLHDLVAALAGPWSTQREQDRNQRRGSGRQRAPGAGPPPKLTLADRILATLLHQHLALPCPLLAQLLGVNRTTISRAIQETRPLLDQHGLAAARQPAARLHTLAGISAYAASHGIIT